MSPQDYTYSDGSGEQQQPLLPNGRSAGGSGGGGNRGSGSSTAGGPALPPGHPNGGGYHLGQYPQYYPPHHAQSREGIQQNFA